jgi:low temperature requirement protein LtrA
VSTTDHVTTTAPTPPAGAAQRRVHDWEEIRHATWLELFFDLVFVVAVARLAVLLHDDHSITGALRFVGLFVPIWWAWISFSYYADLFDDDGPVDRVAQLTAMLGAAILAITLRDGVDDDGAVFAATLAGMFLLLAALYARAGRGQHPGVELCRWYTAGSLIGAAGWLCSLAVPAPGRYWVWAVTLALNAAISGPVAYARVRQVPVQRSHMPERFGLFTIVVLGEALLAVVNGVDHSGWGPATTIAAVAGFTVAAGIWWTYFKNYSEDVIDTAITGGTRTQVRSFLYGYGHLWVYASIAAVGVGVELIIDEAAHDANNVPLFGVAVAAVLAGFVAISAGIGRRPNAATGSAKLLLGAGALALSLTDLHPTLTLAFVAAGWIALVIVEDVAGPSFDSHDEDELDASVA